MKLCRFGIHKWTQWRTPRRHIQSRQCIYCGLYQKIFITIGLPGFKEDVLQVDEEEEKEWPQD